MSEDQRVISHEAIKEIARRVFGFVENAERASVVISSWWNGELAWARNRVSLASDRRDISVEIILYKNGWSGSAVTNQIDDTSLRSAVRAAERVNDLKVPRKLRQIDLKPPEFEVPASKIWSDHTANVTAEQRGSIARLLADTAEQKSLLSAGYIEMRISELGIVASDSTESRYHAFTQSQCSVTARSAKGVGSGWAGLSSFDWSAIDGPTLAGIALSKCERSLNPVAIEPGRYVVILEPQAVADIYEPIHLSFGIRGEHEGQQPNVWTLGFDQTIGLVRSKLGLKVIDDRISIEHDPLHLQLGVIPGPGLKPITWIKDGVLQTLSYDRSYALSALGENDPQFWRNSYRMTGGTTTIEEMIEGTKRGLLVTRFFGVSTIDPLSLLCTGVTRDGLWLIENGKISKAVKNMRFTESPIFMLNQVQELGVPKPVFRPVNDPYSLGLTPAMVPPIKANDFSFTSLIDAV